MTFIFWMLVLILAIQLSTPNKNPLLVAGAVSTTISIIIIGVLMIL